MRKLFFISFALLLVMFFVGCDKTNEDIDAPTNLTASASSNGASVILEWAHPSDTTGLDGYIIEFNGTALNADPILATTYTHSNPATTGEYSVIAVSGDHESDPATISTAPVVNTYGPIYYLLATGHSGFGWNTSGIGQTYSAVLANIGSIDMILDEDMDFVSPNTRDGWGAGRATQILDSWNTGSPIPVPEDYGTAGTAGVPGSFLVAKVASSGYYLIGVEVTSVNSTEHSVMIRSSFQKIMNLRLL